MGLDLRIELEDGGSGLYSCYFLRFRVGLVHGERLADIAGNKRSKRQGLPPSFADRLSTVFSGLYTKTIPLIFQ